MSLLGFAARSSLNTSAVNSADVVQGTDVGPRVAAEHDKVGVGAGSDRAEQSRRAKGGGAALPQRLEDLRGGPARVLDQPLGPPGQVVIVVELAAKRVGTERLGHPVFPGHARVAPD